MGVAKFEKRSKVFKMEDTGNRALVILFILHVHIWNSNYGFILVIPDFLRFWTFLYLVSGISFPYYINFRTKGIPFPLFSYYI